MRDTLPKRTTIICFIAIILFYVASIFLTFRTRSPITFNELYAFALTIIGGLATFILGYASVIILGGKYSVGLIEFISRLNGSTHVLDQKKNTKSDQTRDYDKTLIYFPILVFLITLAITINVHYLHTTTDISLQVFTDLKNALTFLDIFIKPTNISSITYSIEIIPIIVFFIAIAGILPSIVLPYLRKFNVTSVNAAPFHRDILFNIIGTLFGITIVLSLVDIIYGLLTGNQPRYYSYVLPTLVGFSLHYSLGVFAGIDKAEKMVQTILESGYGKRIFYGKVITQGTRKEELKQ